MKDLTGKVAVITGAGSGIGRALAVKLANEDCSLALVDVSEKGLQHTLAILHGRRNKITTHIANVADRARMQALPTEIAQAHGGIDLLFNNAGVTINKSFEDSSLDDLDFVININLYGVIYGCHYFLPYLKQRPGAHIVNTSSLAGFLGLPNQASYCLSKAAVKSLSETLRAELAVHDIGVTSIHPGTIRTNILRAAAGKSGENQATTEKLAGLMERFGMPPETLALKVVNAVKHNHMLVRIGWDSFLGDWLKRLFPRGVHTLLQWGFAKEFKNRQLTGTRHA